MPSLLLRRRVLSAALMLSGCGLAGGGFFGSRIPTPPPKAAVLEPVEADVRVSLLWSDAVDLDLYVTDPDLETVYFANNPSGSGGILQRDVRCAELGGEEEGRALVESAYWPKARPGRYRIGVDFIDACGSGIEDTEFRVVVETASEKVERLSRVKLERFEPVVLEFDLPLTGDEQEAT